MIKSVSFHAPQPGPRLLILGGIHGNEICGPIAIPRVIAEIENGAMRLTRGSVTFVPICNPEAYRQGKRFIDRNLNRYLVPMPSPDCYEAKLGNILCPLLESCDVLLDIHSYTVGGKPFIFASGNNQREMDFAAQLGGAAIVSGWSAAHAATSREQKAQSPHEATGITEYARLHGAISVTLECGHHHDPASPQIAYDAIQRALGYLGLTETKVDLSPTSMQPTPHYIMRQFFYRDAEGSFTKPWQHLDPVKKDEIIGTYADGRSVTAPFDGHIVLPNTSAQIGHEWFYLAVDATHAPHAKA